MRCNGAMRIWGFEDLGSTFKTWWNWGQNMMKLGPKHGEIHILCRTTFCPSFVPHMRDLRDIFQLSLIMRDIFIQWECFIVVMWLVSLSQDQFKTGIMESWGFEDLWFSAKSSSGANLIKENQFSDFDIFRCIWIVSWFSNDLITC